MKKIVLIILFSLAFFGCKTEEKCSTQQWLYFDTLCEIKLFGRIDAAKQDRIFAQCGHILGVYDSLFDAYDTTSIISKLSFARNETLIVSKKVSDALHKMHIVSANTNFLVDYRLGFLIDLWAVSPTQTKIPTRAQLDSALTLCKNGDIVFTNDSAIYVAGNVNVNCGAFLKGYIVDLLYDSLFAICDTDTSFRGFLIDIGRNLKAFHKKRKFSIGIASPRGDDVIAAFDLPSTYACATAGDYERCFFVDGKRYHHIFDPRTGECATGAIGATIVGNSALACDVFSTAAVIYGNDVSRIIDTNIFSYIIFRENNGKVEYSKYGKTVFRKL